jgi:hypothetical protein
MFLVEKIFFHADPANLVFQMLHWLVAWGNLQIGQFRQASQGFLAAVTGGY